MTDESRDRAASAVRDTLPNGGVRVRYADLPTDGALETVPDLTLGAVDGEPALIFGDVRGIDVGRDGTIYVLDYQASEVRAFGREGRFLRRVAARGEGPGELTEANGMILVGDSVLWIQDHGKWAMIGVSTEGEEVGRFPMPVRSYGYMWDGTVDRAGRFWKPIEHRDEEWMFPPEEGLTESTFRRYLKWYDPTSDVADSVYLGDGTRRTHIARNRLGGHSYRGIRFDPEAIAIVDPGGGFWQTERAAYRIARLDERGDTVLVIEVDVEPLPVTQSDRSDYVEADMERSPDQRRAAEEVAALMPETKPVVAGLVVDDVRRLWVGRIVGKDETPLYDVFDRHGTYVGSVRLGFKPSPYLPLKIRGGQIYALVRDELDIPFVVRAGVPELERPTPLLGLIRPYSGLPKT
jgi:hypothetical protein